MAETKALILLSGGLDSTVNLYLAREVLDVRLGLTIDYGQRAFPREVAAAQRSCQHLAIEHLVLDLRAIFADVQTSLVNHSAEIPTGIQIDITSREQSAKTAEKVWVPNRNGVILNVAACVAESRGLQFVVPGFNWEEAQTFPDNSEQFMEALNHALAFSTMSRVRVQCYTHQWDKLKIYSYLKKFNISETHIWSCYFGGEAPCGECESCLRYQRAKKTYEENYA